MPQSNWLPTPAGRGFALTLRLYNSKPHVLDGTWFPSPIEAVLDVQYGQLPRFDFDVIHSALTGNDHWTRASHESLPKQLPDGASWIAELPKALEWLRSTSDAEDQLRRLQRKRAYALFGPLPEH